MPPRTPANVGERAGLERLEELHLDGTPVRDITPLVGLKRLKWLNLFHTRVTDLSPLEGLKGLSVLHADGKAFYKRKAK